MKKSISLENFTEVMVGKLWFYQVNLEITRYIMKVPKRLIIEIDVLPDGYQTTIYIPTKDIKRKR